MDVETRHNNAMVTSRATAFGTMADDVVFSGLHVYATIMPMT